MASSQVGFCLCDVVCSEFLGLTTFSYLVGYWNANVEGQMEVIRQWTVDSWLISMICDESISIVVAL